MGQFSARRGVPRESSRRSGRARRGSRALGLGKSRDGNRHGRLGRSFFGPSPPASLAARRDANARRERARANLRRSRRRVDAFGGEDSRGRSLTFAASAAESFVALNLYGCGWREAGRRPSACECEEMLGNDGAAGEVARVARTRAPRTRSGRTPGRGMNHRRGATGGSAGVARTRGGTRARRFARAQPPATRVGESRRGFFHPGLVATGGRAHLWKEAVEAVEQIGVSPQEFFNPADHLRGVAPARGAGRGAFSGGCLSAESSGEKRHCGAPFGSSLATHLAFLKSLMTSRKAS